MNKSFVLDAWAFLALLQKEEPAASRVRRLLQEAMRKEINLYLSIINMGEIYYRVGRAKGRDEAEETLKALSQLSLKILPATDATVMAAAALKMEFAVSYADAFAAAEAREQNATLVTGDLELFQLQGFIRIDKLKRKRH